MKWGNRVENCMTENGEALEEGLLLSQDKGN